MLITLMSRKKVIRALITLKVLNNNMFSKNSLFKEILKITFLEFIKLGQPK